MDVDDLIAQLNQQNNELLNILQNLVREVAELRRRVDRVENEYYKHSHSSNGTMPQ